MPEITVRDLIQHLQKFNGDLPLVYSTDDEGNMYHPVLFGPSEGFWNKEMGEFIGIDEITMEDENHFPKKVVCIN